VQPNESGEQVTRRESIDRALESCRDRLREQLLKDASASALRAPIREFASLASRYDIPPERVLAMIKSVLNGVPSFERRNSAQRADLTAQFAQIAIQAYYAEGDGQRAD
jgi:hypothetical protein